MIEVAVTPDQAYVIYLIDSYNNSFYGDMLGNPIKAVWFQVYDADQTTAYTGELYQEAEMKEEYGGMGGYTVEGEGYSAILKAKSDKLYLMVMGSKVNESL